MSGSKVYIIAGEPSGDLHGANLLKSLKRINSALSVRFWGGDKMAEVAGKPEKHIRDLAFMGFFEVIANIRTIAKNFKLCKAQIEAFAPDVLVLIDYPGFNLRMAAWAKSKGIKVVYYISPQVWAWKENRVKKIKAYVDKLLVILPFEKDFFAKHQIEAEFVGHPLLDEIKSFKASAETKEQFIKRTGISNESILVLLPGSRQQEVRVKLPLMLEAVKDLKGYQILIGGAPTLEQAFYQSVLNGVEATILYGETYNLLNHATAGLITSGTATLETALFEVPQVVCYKGNSISYHIAKQLVKIKYISLVNLIMDEEVVTELIQNECTAERMKAELEKVLPGGNHRANISLKYKELIEKLGAEGASDQAAKAIVDQL